MTAPAADIAPLSVRFVPGQPYTVLVRSASSERDYAVDWAVLADGRFTTECECEAQVFHPTKQCKHGKRAEEVIRATKEFQTMTQPKGNLAVVPQDEAASDAAENIEQAILAVYNKVGYVQKRHSQGLNYTYAGEKDLIEALRPAMVEEGITARVERLRDVHHEQIPMGSKGTVQQHTTLIAVVRFTHGPSGTFIDCEAAGEGADSGDKSFSKASTGAYKYALRQTFCIETGDDPDDSRPELAGDGAPQRTAPRQEASAVDTESVDRVPDAQWRALLATMPKQGVKRAQVEAVLGGWGPDAMAEWLDGNPTLHFGNLLSAAATGAQ